MKFGIIDAENRIAVIEDHADFRAALAAVGLRSGAIDFGGVSRHPIIQIVVYEYGLFVPRDQQHYFALNGRLYAGNAVLEQADDEGRAVDLEKMPAVRFLPTGDDAENAIQKGLVPRPKMSRDGVVYWQWPQPRPTNVREMVAEVVERMKPKR
jgi:hypothetical protein